MEMVIQEEVRCGHPEKTSTGFSIAGESNCGPHTKSSVLLRNIHIHIIKKIVTCRPYYIKILKIVHISFTWS